MYFVLESECVIILYSKIDNTAVYFNFEINSSILFESESESESEDALVMLPSTEIDDTTVYFKQPSSLPTSVSFMLAWS